MENGTIVLKEDRSTVKKMWEGIVNFKVKANQIFIKGTPVLFAVSSVFAPEAAPALLAVATFLETKTGQDLLKFAMKTEEISGDVWKGDTTEAKDKINQGLEDMLKSDINYAEVLKDVNVLSRGGKSND